MSKSFLDSNQARNVFSWDKGDALKGYVFIFAVTGLNGQVAQTM